MKLCTKCNTLKLANDYFVRNKAKGRLHAQCKACYKNHRRSYHAGHYVKYRQNYLKRASARNLINRKKLRVKMLSYLQNKTCTICGFSDIRALEFDHINPNLKSFSIARALSDGCSWERILIEIKKCRIVCANCHKIRTAGQFKWYRNGAVAEELGKSLQNFVHECESRPRLQFFI